MKIAGKFSLVVFWLLFVLAGCDSAKVEKVTGPTMGTRYHVKYIADANAASQQQVKQVVQQVLDDINARMSTYINDSELMQFNAAATNQPYALSADIIELVALSQQLSRLSSGAYDVTVGPLVNLWGFGPDHRPDQVPAAAQIKAAFAKVGYDSVEVNKEQNQLTKRKPVFVDLSSIAKGYAVDQVAKALEGLSISSYMVEVGGELKAKGLKPTGEHWRIGIEQPKLMVQQEPSLVVQVDGKGVATSGDYRNYFEAEGKRYSHTIDPRTGYPITHRLASVTVIDDTVARADALSTMFMVLGSDQGLTIANQENIAAYFIVKTEQGFKSVASEAFKAYLARQRN
ncbi:FAD:protein FMN transferase [Spartinivicinus poritis]|uniref:FAD:protein FMN transferase n=1 Tax=Spartinivicinus poritis TaxID=2994640 RepID=A0ABT5U9B7_9GAMM|nr:FAD:protein FMN transferase [Spartinivicinus sp. A2-2]MDE1462601.1 FAD:protein FMN transferase [Spartinivicinus sp. A2-2]